MIGLPPKPVVADNVLAAMPHRPKKRKQSEGPQEDRFSSTQWRTPWLDTLPKTEYESKGQRLHDEIVAFLTFAQPTSEEVQARDLVLSKVTSILQSRFSRCTISTYGSVAYGLALPDGDLDLVISTTEVYNKDYLKRVLFQLSSKLKNSGAAASCQVIPYAKIPIIKLETTPSLASFHFDININAEDGLKAVPTIKRYVDEMPALRPLVLSLKSCLAMRDLNSPASGGLGSYATICSAIGFLKLNPYHREQELIDKPMEKEALGILLMDFFNFYGNDFPYETSYISATQGKILPKDTKGWLNEKYPGAFAIECLMDPANNVGKAAQRIRQIRQVFQEAYRSFGLYALKGLIPETNVSNSIIGVSDATLSRRERIRELVNSGALRSALSAIVPPPPPLVHSNSRRPHYVHPPQGHPSLRGLPFAPSGTSRHLPHRLDIPRTPRIEGRSQQSHIANHNSRTDTRSNRRHDRYSESPREHSSHRTKRRRD